MDFALQSTVFMDNGVIPKMYSGEDRNISPPLRWSGYPRETEEFALICDDPDAPRTRPFVHWVAYHIPLELRGLPEDIPVGKQPRVPGRFFQGKNSRNICGYAGPLPPEGDGWHHYRFRLFALDELLDLSPDEVVTKERLQRAMVGHILAKAELSGRYRRDKEPVCSSPGDFQSTRHAWHKICSP